MRSSGCDEGKNTTNNSAWQTLGPLMFSGTQLAITCLLGLFLGDWLDNKFDTTPVLTLIFSFLFASVAFRNFLRTIKNTNKK
jgi:F0F1-type ATP synthase assembly protein I